MTINLTVGPYNVIGGNLSASVTGLSNDEGGIVQLGFVPVGVNPAPIGAGYLVVAAEVAEENGNATFSVPLPLAGVQALAPDLRMEPIFPGAQFDCYAYDAATGSAEGYSNAVTVTITNPLGSNANYIIDSGCAPLENPTISIQVTQEMLASNGFGFQWNAYSPKGQTCAYQQYCMIVPPLVSGSPQLLGAVDNWPVSGNNLLNDFFALATLPTEGLQVGDVLSMTLVTDPNGNITACTFHWNNVTATLELSSIAGFQPSYLAPIVAYEMNIVGPFNGEATIFSSGAGMFAYSAANAMSPLLSPPTCTETPNVVTAETANSTYGSLPTGPATAFTQTFETGISPAIVIHGATQIEFKPYTRQGTPRPATQFKGRTPRVL